VIDAREELSVGRLEAFSDAVFAIAITLIVLELGISPRDGDHLLSSILHHWSSYLAYLTSFLTIGVVWLQHSAITHTLRAADATLYRINLLVLLLVSFLPFPTKIVVEFIAEGGPERVAAVFYGLTMLAISLALLLFGRYVAKGRWLVKDQVEADAIESAMGHSPSFVLYLVGIGVSLVLPTAGIAIYLASAIARAFSARRFNMRRKQPR
jgi:TMEM175 potassium channel family protein